MKNGREFSGNYFAKTGSVGTVFDSGLKACLRCLVLQSFFRVDLHFQFFPC